MLRHRNTRTWPIASGWFGLLTQHPKLNVIGKQDTSDVRLAATTAKVGGEASGCLLAGLPATRRLPRRRL